LLEWRVGAAGWSSKFYNNKSAEKRATILPATPIKDGADDPDTYGLYFPEQHVDKNEQKKVALEISSATFC